MTTAVVLIEADRDAMSTLGGALADLEGVAEAYSVTGEWDFVAIVRVPEHDRLASVVTEQPETGNKTETHMSTALVTGSSTGIGYATALELARGGYTVVAAMRNPYDVASFSEAPTVLDTYGYTSDQIESLARVLFGEVNPTGRLPVSIPGADGTGELFPFGHGLGY